MKLCLRTIASVTLAGCITVPVAAHTMKAGLWEIESKMQSSDGRMENAQAHMQKKIAGMSPEKRKKMEEILASQGLSMPVAGGAGMVTKICMTPEMVARSELPIQQRGECKATMIKTGGDTRKLTFTCAKPPSSGEGHITLSSDTTYTMHINATSHPAGKPDTTMTMDASGRWLAADCGAIHPIEMPPAN